MKNLMLVIEDFWIWNDSTPPEKKSAISYKNAGGWSSVDEWRKSVRSRGLFDRFDESGRAIFKPQMLSNGVGVMQIVSLVQA